MRLLALAGPGATAAESVLPASADTALFATTPGNNLGRSEMLAVGATGKGFPARSLMRFDLTGVVADPATVVAARLEFTVVRAPAGDEGSEVRVHRMLTDWVEGRGTGTLGEPATAGEPTWS
ncbi:MAG: DNRLRE domain-containing protein, partial [Verrucomicrobiales bacterium]|nr:DNRLRE domain-containing protein [Verrucomicrobiales bacterium]